MKRKNEIIEGFLKKGYFIDEKILSKFNEEELLIVLEKIEKSNFPKKLEEEEIKNLLKFNVNFQILNLKKDGEFSIYDFSKILLERYEYFFKILSSKTLIPIYSINKIKKMQRYGIIGFVFNEKGEEITVEDLTGTINLLNPKNLKVWKDSCLLFFCNNEVIEEIIYPEINFKKFSSTLFIGYKKMLNLPSIIFSNEISTEKNTLSVDFNFQDVFQIKFGSEFIILIDSSKIDFEKEKFQKTRLIVTETEKVLKYGKDIYLVKDEPSLIILANSDETKIIDEIPLTIKIKEGDNVLIKNEGIRIL